MINESRLKNGTLTLGDTGTEADASCQITNVRITSAYSDDGDSVTTLCGDTKPPPRKLDGHKLEGTLVQDFDVDETTGGIIAYLWAHDLEVVAYSYVPNADGAPTITGTLMIEIPAETYGGDVNKRITSDFTWNLQEKPTFTPAIPLARTAAAQVAGAQVQVRGGDRLAATAADAAKAIADLSDGFAEAGRIVTAAGETAAPRLTGRLAGSLRSAPAGRNTASLTSPLVYAVPIHWGRPAHNIAADPFLFRAAERTEPQWLGALERDAQRVCNGVEGAQLPCDRGSCLGRGAATDQDPGRRSAKRGAGDRTYAGGLAGGVRDARVVERPTPRLSRSPHREKLRPFRGSLRRRGRARAAAGGRGAGSDGPYPRGGIGRLAVTVAVHTGISYREWLRDPAALATAAEVLEELGAELDKTRG